MWCPFDETGEQQGEGLCYWQELEEQGMLADLLARVERLIARYVIVSRPALVAIVLWVAHTHALDAFDVTPYLAVTSPEKRSGKTRLLEVLELLGRHVWRAVQLTEAVLFRKIEKDSPTLLLDEVDAVFRGTGNPVTEGLRAILNAGYRRGAVVPRCVGENHDVKDFKVFCAKALAGIGTLPDTVGDRSIRIRLKRRKEGERVERFKFRRAKGEAAPLRKAFKRWAAGAVPRLRGAEPVVPEELHDRAAEVWEPLLAVADLAGDKWPGLARWAARALHHAEPGAESTGVALLRAIKETFAECQVKRLLTGELLTALVEREGEPWGELWGAALDDKRDLRGPGFKLAKLLRPYGIAAKDIRVGEQRGKGYELGDFADAFSRYLDSPRKTT